MMLVLNFLVPYELRELGPSKQIKIIRRLNASGLLIIGRLKHLLRNVKKKMIRLKKQKLPWKEGSGRLLMMDVDDDEFKIYTASRLNKARGLTKGRAAPCREAKAAEN